MPLAVFPFFPAVAVAILVEVIAAHRQQCDAAASFQLILEPLQAMMIYGVFQACVLALLAVAVVTLQGDHALGNGKQLLWLYKPYQAAQSWVGGVIAMGGAHAAADSHVETLQYAIFNNGDQAQILRKYINIVGGRNGNADLELAWQVGVTVNRLDFGLIGDFLAIQPDFMI